MTKRLKAIFWTHFEWRHIIISADRFYLNWYNKGPRRLCPYLCLILWRWGSVGPMQLYAHAFGFEFRPWDTAFAADWIGVRFGRFYLRTFWSRSRP